MLQASSRHAVEAGLLQEIVSFGRRPYAGATLSCCCEKYVGCVRPSGKWSHGDPAYLMHKYYGRDQIHPL